MGDDVALSKGHSDMSGPTDDDPHHPPTLGTRRARLVLWLRRWWFTLPWVERLSLRRFNRKARRRYAHMTPWRSCNEMFRGWCWHCFWRDMTGQTAAALEDRRRRSSR